MTNYLFPAMLYFHFCQTLLSGILKYLFEDIFLILTKSYASSTYGIGCHSQCFGKSVSHEKEGICLGWNPAP
jgi:hypothetical protein